MSRSMRSACGRHSPTLSSGCGKGTRFTVIYRSRPAFQIVPVDDQGSPLISLADDPLYRARPVGSSKTDVLRRLRCAVLSAMNAVFVDTGGWMACADRADPAHSACSAARDAILEAGRTLITTDFVVDETLTLIRFRLGLAAANAWWHHIDGSARLRWERVDNDRLNGRETCSSSIAIRTCRSPTAQASR